MPVVETTPPVLARPKAWVSRLYSPQVRPASARAMRFTGSTLTLFIGDSSFAVRAIMMSSTSSPSSFKKLDFQ